MDTRPDRVILVDDRRVGATAGGLDLDVGRSIGSYILLLDLQVDGAVRVLDNRLLPLYTYAVDARAGLYVIVEDRDLDNPRRIGGDIPRE